MELSRQTLEHIPFSWLYARVDALHTPKGEWVLNELEMIEPSLFFRHARHALRRALELDPDCPGAEAALAEVEEIALGRSIASMRAPSFV